MASAWAVNANNAIFNRKGLSSYQLVLGHSPNLPSVMTDHTPASEGVATNERVVMHLNALHAARKAHIKVQMTSKFLLSYLKVFKSQIAFYRFLMWFLVPELLWFKYLKHDQKMVPKMGGLG